MRKSYLKFAYLLFLAAIFMSPSQSLSQQSSFEEGMEWYQQRAAEADSFQAKPQYIEKAINAFEKALQEDARHEQAILHLLKSYYFKGMFVGLEKDEQKKVHDKGRELGDKAVNQFPESVEIKFWYGANLGRWAKVHGFVASATSGVAKKLRSLSEEIISLDEKYQGGGGYRILAQVHFYSPKIPILMGWPSDQKALELIEEAMNIAPEHPTNRLLYAEVLISFDRIGEAREHLDYLLNMEPRPEFLIPDRYVKYRADELLKNHYGV